MHTFRIDDGIAHVVLDDGKANVLNPALCAAVRGGIEAAADAIRRETGARVLAVASDVSDAAQAERLAALAVDAYGGLEIAVHNAGGPPAGDFREWDEGHW